MNMLIKYLENINRISRGLFLMIWVLLSILVVSFLRFHAIDEIVSIFAIAAVIAQLFVRLLPARSGFWAAIFCGCIALLISVYVDVSAVLANSYQVSLGVGVSLFFVLMAVSRRPAFSFFLCAVIVVGLVGISHTKYEYTGVPLLWLDLHLAASTWQFLLDMQSIETLLVQLVMLAFVIGLWRMDKPVSYSERRKTWAATLVGGLLVSSSALATATFATGHDILRTGWEENKLDPWAVFIGSVFEISDMHEPTEYDPKICCMTVKPEHHQASSVPIDKPHVVVILEESTFPPAMLSKAKLELDFFEQAYPMTAEVVGGGTWLSEYALLHGVPPTVYGSAGRYINLLGPGRVQGRLPFFLKEQGYSTTTIYPVHHRFYGASAFHHSLGMNQFIDCKEVPGCNTKTTEVHDYRFFDVAEKMLRTSNKPAFIFLPTIRQHSPHDGKAKESIPCDELTDAQCKVIAIYAERLKDSVNEFEKFIGGLEHLDREVIVLAFGDHIPGDVARTFKESDFLAGKKRTFFTVWSSRRGYLTNSVMSSLGTPDSVHNAYLDLIVARAAGFNSPYFDAKEVSMRVCPSTYCSDSKGGS